MNIVNNALNYVTNNLEFSIKEAPGWHTIAMQSKIQKHDTGDTELKHLLVFTVIIIILIIIHYSTEIFLEALSLQLGHLEEKMKLERKQPVIIQVPKNVL